MGKRWLAFSLVLRSFSGSLEETVRDIVVSVDVFLLECRQQISHP
jgi:hypothetical protein